MLREGGGGGVGGLGCACCVGLGGWAVMMIGRVRLGGGRQHPQEHHEWAEHCLSYQRGKGVLGQERLCYLCYHHSLYLRGDHQWKKKRWKAACHLEHQT